MPPHGLLSTTVRKADTVVNMSCNAGYTLFGKESVRCLRDGHWSGILGDCINGKMSLLLRFL